MYIRTALKLLSIQLINYLGPLIALPLLFKGFNAAEFGVFVFYVAIYNFMSVFSDMGIGNTAPRILAVRGRAGQISEFFSIAITIRFIAFTIIFLMTWAILGNIFTEKYKLDCILIIYFAGIPLVFNINQFAILKGESEIILRPAVVSKIAYLILISAQLKYGFNLLFSIGVYIFCNSMQYLHSYYKFCVRHGYGIKKYKLIKLKLQIKKIRTLTSSSVIVWIYSSSPIFIIEKMYGAEAVGLYGAAERIVNAIKSLFAPLQQVMQLYVIRSNDKDNKLHYKMLALLMGIGGIVTIILAISASDMIGFLAGEKYGQASLILVAMAGLPILLSLSGYMGNCILLIKGENSLYFQSLLFGFIVYGVGAFVINVAGLKISILVGLQTLVEIVVCLSMIRYFIKK